MGSSASRRPRGVSTSSSASSVFSAPIVCSRSIAVRTERSSGGCTAFDRKVEMLLSVLLATEEASLTRKLQFYYDSLGVASHGTPYALDLTQ